MSDQDDLHTPPPGAMTPADIDANERAYLLPARGDDPYPAVAIPRPGSDDEALVIVYWKGDTLHVTVDLETAGSPRTEIGVTAGGPTHLLQSGWSW